MMLEKMNHDAWGLEMCDKYSDKYGELVKLDKVKATSTKNFLYDMIGLVMYICYTTKKFIYLALLSLDQVMGSGMYYKLKWLISEVR